MGLFAHLMHQRERFLGIPYRKRQSMVPDFMLIPEPPQRQLSDVKRIYCGDTRSNLYCGAAQEERSGAVNRRAAKVHTDCHVQMRKADRKYNGVDPQDDNPGPLQAALEAYGRVQGWVLGAFGEASRDLHTLVKLIGDLGASRGWREMGARTVVEASAVLHQRARRHIGIEAVRSHARLKLDRLAWVTGGAAAAGTRRTNARSRARAQRDAYNMRNGPRAYASRRC